VIYSLVLPEIVEGMTSADVQALYCGVGEGLKRGSKILDLTVDLSAAFPHDCPPVSHYRLAARDPLFVRQIMARPGAPAAVGETLALLSTTADESLDDAPTAAARLTVVGIVNPSDLWA
jgi:hypothetical protein